MLPLVGVLHAKARALCTERLVALHHSATALPSDEAVRWAFASQLLHQVEQLGPGDFDDAEEERETLELAIEGAVDAMRKFLPDVRAGVVEGERARFVALLDDPSVSPTDVPLRRIATTKEYAHLSRAFQERFPPGTGAVTPAPLRWDALRDVLREHAVASVWLLHPTTPALSTIADVQLLGTRLQDGAPAWFPPMPVYVFDEGFAMFVHVDEHGCCDRTGGWTAAPETTARIAPALQPE